MSKLDFRSNFAAGYSAPAVEICSVNAERGFFASQNPDLSYGDGGEAGAIENGNSYDL